MGEPDRNWIDTPEFDWIPDKPFRVAVPIAANSQELPPIVAPPRKIPPPAPEPPNPFLAMGVERAPQRLVPPQLASGPHPFKRVVQTGLRSTSATVGHVSTRAKEKIAGAVATGSDKIALVATSAGVKGRSAASRLGVNVFSYGARARDAARRHGGSLFAGAAWACDRLGGLSNASARAVATGSERIAHATVRVGENGRSATSRLSASLLHVGTMVRGAFKRVGGSFFAGAVWLCERIGRLSGNCTRAFLSATGQIFSSGKNMVSSAFRPAIVAPRHVAANNAPSYLTAQLVVGAAQGIGLVLLAAGHRQSMLASALTMLLLFTPLLLLTGLGRIPGKLLLPWTAVAGIALAALGAYQFWRSGEITTPAIVMSAIALFIGQAMVTAWAKDGQPLAAYSAFHNSAWSLAIQAMICGLCAAVAALAADTLSNVLRQNFSGAHILIPVTPLATLAVAFASWSLAPSLLRRLAQGLLAVLVLMLPLLALLAAAFTVAGLAQQWQPPMLLSIGLAALLLAAINASYNAGEERLRWQQNAEFVASLMLGPLVAMGALALQARVAQLGWTEPRIFVAASLGVLGTYAAFYGVAALISLGGGAWMQRIERANLAIALAIMALIAALASPIADPARLAVRDQLDRVNSGKVSPDAFDFRYLAKDSARFGHDALMQLTALQTKPAVARGAFVALVTDPVSAQPTPTQIGANIEVQSGHALPASLLAQDWSKVPGKDVPPCLSTAALRCEAYFADMDGDGRDEIVLAYGTGAAWWAAVMKEGREGWYPAGTLASPSCPGSLNALRAGRFAPVDPLPGWRDLLVGGARLTIALPQKAQAGCPR